MPPFLTRTDWGLDSAQLRIQGHRSDLIKGTIGGSSWEDKSILLVGKSSQEKGAKAH